MNRRYGNYRVCENCGEELTAENDSRCTILPLCQDCYDEAESLIVRPKDVSVRFVAGVANG